MRSIYFLFILAFMVSVGGLPAAAMPNLAGRYPAPGGAITVGADGDRLVIATAVRNALTGAEYAAPTRRAAAIGDTEFVIKDTEMEGSRFDFLLHPDGTPRFLRLGGRLYDRV